MRCLLGHRICAVAVRDKVGNAFVPGCETNQREKEYYDNYVRDAHPRVFLVMASFEIAVQKHSEDDARCAKQPDDTGRYDGMEDYRVV